MKVSRVRLLGRQFHPERHDILPFEAITYAISFAKLIRPTQREEILLSIVGGFFRILLSTPAWHPEGVAHVASVGVKLRRRAELMTFCNRVGVNILYIMQLRKDVFNQECGITCLEHLVVIRTFRRCTKLTRLHGRIILGRILANFNKTSCHLGVH